jgi:hypothetical protein
MAFVSMPTTQSRAVVAVLIGIACGVASWATTQLPGFPDQDFAVWYLAAKALVHGDDPYTAVAVPPFNGFVHPLPAALVTIPVVWLPVTIAGPLSVGFACGLLAFVASRTAWWPLWMFISGAMLLSVMAAQWSPLLSVPLFLPGVVWLGVIKPNVGLALLASRFSWRAVATMATILIACLVVRPTWPHDWLAAVRSSPVHFAVWRAPGGVVLLLVLSKWRRPEARLLAVMALVPSSPIVYEALPLFAIPRIRIEMLVLCMTTVLMFALMLGRSLQADPDAYLSTARPAMLWLVYVPVLLMVLRRPNEGDVPAWVERTTVWLPRWLRGSPAPISP